VADPDASSGTSRWLNASSKVEDLSEQPDPLLFAGLKQDLFGPYRGRHDLYAVGPFADLVGRPAVIGTAELAEAEAVYRDASAFDDVEMDSGLVPALFVADVSGIEPGTWMALAIDGVVAGTGPVYDDEGETIVEIMVDPELMHDGDNDVRVFAIDDQTSELVPIAGS
jgi:hypothetical protein